jgi:hypothetical protein
MKRTDKIKILEKVFNENDLSSLAEKTKGYSMVLHLRHDERSQRQEVATFGNGLTLWNYNEDEAETVRKKLLTQYEIVWVTECETV